MKPIRAHIIGSSQVTANGVTVRGRTPILSLCRRLVALGHDPNTPLEAYRGTTLCLRISSIGYAATLGVKESSSGQPYFRPLTLETAVQRAVNPTDAINQPPPTQLAKPSN